MGRRAGWAGGHELRSALVPQPSAALCPIGAHQRKRRAGLQRALAQTCPAPDVVGSARPRRSANPNIALASGNTPLIACTESGRADIARLLLEDSADINAHTPLGKTALMVACHAGNGALARLLLNEGATTGEVKANKGTPLISAASVGHADCVRMIIEEV